MKLIDTALLNRFRRARQCELCLKTLHTGADPHHLWTRAAGRVDLPCNLASLCREDHNKVEAIPLHAWRIRQRVALREGKTFQEIKAIVDRVRRCQVFKVWDVQERGPLPLEVCLGCDEILCGGCKR